MDLRHLRYFLTVAEHGSFNAAAASAHISQPSISIAIRQLESELGEALFVRGAKGVELTEAGRTFSVHARSVLREADKAIDEVRSLNSTRRGKVAVGITAVFSTFIAPQALAAFHRRHPDVNVAIDVSTHTPSILRDAIEGGAWDFAFVLMRPDTAIPEDWTVEILASFESGVYAAANHPLARSKNVPAEKLAQYTWIVSSYGAGESYLQRTFSSAGAPVPRVKLVSNSFNLMRDMLDQHPFLSMLPHRFAARDVAAGHLVQIDQRLIAVTSRSALIRLGRTALSQTAADLMDEFRAACR